MSDHGALDLAALMDTRPELEAARLRFAEARVRELEALERGLLELAVAADDDAARWLELHADTAWRDALAVQGEHRPTSCTCPEADA